MFLGYLPSLTTYRCSSVLDEMRGTSYEKECKNLAKRKASETRSLFTVVIPVKVREKNTKKSSQIIA